MNIKQTYFIVLLLLLVAACKKEDLPKNVVPTNTADFRGVNWADERDNFVDDSLILSGLSLSMSASQIQAVSQTVMLGFKNNLDANTVRFPINAPTVLGAWWNLYKISIDEALNNNMKVILAYWEADSSRDGFIDDTLEFNTMWQAIINEYGNNPNVYFEIMNEPHGYEEDEWKTVCKEWLNTFSSIPRNRILIAGVGYSFGVHFMASDSDFDGCLFAMHVYGFWFQTIHTVDGWTDIISQAAELYQDRTVITEYGAPMTNQLNYMDTTTQNVYINYMQALSKYASKYKMGSCYWPGLRNNDFYTIQRLQNDSMYTTNATGEALIREAWGIQ